MAFKVGDIIIAKQSVLAFKNSTNKSHLIVMGDKLQIRKIMPHMVLASMKLSDEGKIHVNFVKSNLRCFRFPKEDDT